MTNILTDAVNVSDSGVCIGTAHPAELLAEIARAHQAGVPTLVLFKLTTPMFTAQRELLKLGILVDTLYSKTPANERTDLLQKSQLLLTLLQWANCGVCIGHFQRVIVYNVVHKTNMQLQHLLQNWRGQQERLRMECAP
jgi:hypothetical protein